MTTGILVLLGVLALVMLLGIGVALGVIPLPGAGSSTGNLHKMVRSQRNSLRGDSRGFDNQGRERDPYKTFENTGTVVASSRLTLTKKLKYAQWALTIPIYRIGQVVISLIAFGAVSALKCDLPLRMFSLLAGPIFMGWLLNFAVNRRFKKFDQDYPQFLLSLVGLLKTGMNLMGALDAAAQGLEEGSLVKQEVQVMIERLRFGVSEDKSIGSFGEDIFHPEIELFVQALLLSRRVGGGALSDTLERLAKQVRRRQFFRSSAIAAVGMQRGSIWIIIGILAFIEMYLYIVYPLMVTAALKTELGWKVWQAGIIVILLGIFWVRQVTKFKI
ncbi:MAG: hypothetical protein DCC75_04855 [Proteobacteria bacterium]|nr:MAG: hypothetical protein DCC75_04855 [Pseudomonadota bacterium]